MPITNDIISKNHFGMNTIKEIAIPYGQWNMATIRFRLTDPESGQIVKFPSESEGFQDFSFTICQYNINGFPQTTPLEKINDYMMRTRVKYDRNKVGAHWYRITAKRTSQNEAGPGTVVLAQGIIDIQPLELKRY